MIIPYLKKNLWSLKEVILFCIISALSFVLMSEAVESVDAITSSFITYAMSTIFYIVITAKYHKDIFKIFKSKKCDFFTINISTLVNTFSAFFVMQYVPPLTYVIIFFSSIPIFNSLLTKKPVSRLVKEFGVLIVAILIAGLTAHRPLTNITIGILTTLFSSFFAVIYMRKTSELHQDTAITTTQVLAVRFILVVFVCGSYSVIEGTYKTISFNELSLFFYIALTSSIIPLFLLQSSIRKIGSALTSSFMPLIPILCFVLMVLVSGYTFSIIELGLVIVLTVLLAYQAKAIH